MPTPLMPLLTAPRAASSPGTRSRHGSIAPPMTTRNCCCRSPPDRWRREAAEPKKLAARRPRLRSAVDGQGSLF